MATTNSSMRKSISKQPSNVSVKKSTPKRTKLIPSQLEKLYDKQEKLCARAGNAEERLMRDLSDAVEARKTASRTVARLNKVWENTTSRIDGLMRAAATKCRDTKGEYKEQLCAEINIASFENQIEVYYAGMKQVASILKATQV